MTAQTSPRPILVGIDGSPSGREALALGSALAVLTGAPLVLGAVFGFETASGRLGGLVWPPHSDADRWLGEAESQLGDAVPWQSCTVCAVSPARGLIELAESENAAAIVLGSTHRGPVGRVLAGSTARRVIHGAPCVVAVVPHGWKLRPAPEPVTVGAAVCATDESREALAVAAQLAAPAHASLRVLTVVQLLPSTNLYFGATTTPYSKWAESEHEWMRTVARNAVGAVAAAADAEIELLAGDPEQELAEASAELDFLVVGSRRYGSVRSVMLGGVSSRLIEDAQCALVIVPRGVNSSFETNPTDRAAVRA